MVDIISSGIYYAKQFTLRFTADEPLVQNS